MEEKEISGHESFQLINRMIHEAKGYYYENGLSALVYGFSVLICSVLSFSMAKEIIRFPFHPFYLLIPISFIQSWIHYSQDKKKKAKTFTDEAIDHVWTGFFLTSIVSLSALFAGLNYIAISVILFLNAFASFMTGMIAKFKYLIVTSIIGLLLAACSFFMLNENIYLLLAVVAIMVWIIPGFMLRAVFKEVQKQEGKG
jgi:hypothetical protein